MLCNSSASEAVEGYAADFFEVGGSAEPFEVGTVARIAEVERMPDGRMNLMTFGTTRFRIAELTQ